MVIVRVDTPAWHCTEAWKPITVVLRLRQPATCPTLFYFLWHEKDLLISEEAYSTVFIYRWWLLSYNEVYGIFPQNNLRNFFKGEYADLIEQFANGDYDLWVLNTKLIARLEMQYGKAIPKTCCFRRY